MKLYNGKIRNYEAFINDDSLLRKLQEQSLVRSNKMRVHQQAIDQLDYVVDLINKELGLNN